MLDVLLKTVLPVVGTFAVGAFGWLITHFLADPLLQFGRLRRDIYENLVFTANVSAIVRDDILQDAMSKLRRDGAKLTALWHSTFPVIRWWWGYRGYKIEDASRALIGLSNSLTTENGQRAVFRNRIDRALKLPREYTDEDVQGIIVTMRGDPDRRRAE